METADSSLKSKERKLWIAVIFSIIAPGLGQIYCGHLIRGLVLLMLLTLVSFGKDFILLLATQQSDSPYILLYIIIGLLFLIYIFSIADSISLVRKYKHNFKRQIYNKWYVYLCGFLFTFFIIKPMGLHRFIIQGYRVPSESMAPTIYKGSGIIANKLSYYNKKICRGDVVVFKNPENPRIKLTKRIIGLPGEMIEIRNKQVCIDGNILHETYVVYSDTLNTMRIFFRDNIPVITISEGKYFIMGDNRDYSYDSREWGPVDEKLIEGKVEVIFLSEDQLKWIKIKKPEYKN